MSEICKNYDKDEIHCQEKCVFIDCLQFNPTDSVKYLIQQISNSPINIQCPNCGGLIISDMLGYSCNECHTGFNESEIRKRCAI